MQNKFFKLILILVIGNFCVLNAQNMVIRFKSAIELQKQLGSIKKLTFSSNDMLINYISGYSENVGISDVDKIYFGATSNFSNVSESENDKNPDFYPNPASSIITFKEFSSNSLNVDIYRIDGLKVFSCMLTENNNKIDISNLSAGMYIIRYGEVTRKLIKY
jgi:hypothetical protein